jgi:hypothetical protein
MPPSVFYGHFLERILGEWAEFLACDSPAPDAPGPSPGSPDSEKADDPVPAPKIGEIAA